MILSYDVVYVILSCLYDIWHDILLCQINRLSGTQPASVLIKAIYFLQNGNEINPKSTNVQLNKVGRWYLLYLTISTCISVCPSSHWKSHTIRKYLSRLSHFSLRYEFYFFLWYVIETIIFVNFLAGQLLKTS